MSDEEWKCLLDDSFKETKDMIDAFEKELRKKPLDIAYYRLRTLKNIIFNAVMIELQDRNKRIDEGNDLLKKI